MNCWCGKPASDKYGVTQSGSAKEYPACGIEHAETLARGMVHGRVTYPGGITAVVTSAGYRRPE